MIVPTKSSRFKKAYNEYKLPTWLAWFGSALLAICTVAAFVVAYYHDAYSSILELKELAATDVWFQLFVILMVLGATLLVGSPLLAMVLAGITMLFPSKEPELIEGQPAKETPVVKVESPAVEDAAPARKQALSPSIDEASLRSLLDTPFMRQSSSGSDKTNLDRVIDDLKIVRINYKKGAKDNVHFSDKNITEIARILYTSKYLKRRNRLSFAKWNETLFERMRITAPENINKNQTPGDNVKALFNYLLP